MNGGSQTNNHEQSAIFNMHNYNNDYKRNHFNAKLIKTNNNNKQVFNRILKLKGLKNSEINTPEVVSAVALKNVIVKLLFYLL
jgi:hypothetical protein